MGGEENSQDAEAGPGGLDVRNDLSEKAGPESWFVGHVESEVKKDRLPLSERVGAVIGLVFVLAVTLFWFAHLTSATGFFTSRFGPAEAFLFYLSVGFGVFAAAVTVGIARKNKRRPLDVINMALLFVAMVWLLWVFPFEFAHLADVLPEALRFLLQWISNDVARVLMTIAVIATPIGVVYTAVLYVSVRRELARPQPAV